MKVLDHLVESIRISSSHNPDVQAAPACILWPDHDRQWEDAISLLMAEMPELLMLGDYLPENRSGPAIWLRCAIAGQVSDFTFPEDGTPVLYLPGVSRQDLRAVESCPDHLKPLAELQYRGVIWSQINARDWTILAWLKSDQGGQGLDVAQDQGARDAMRQALQPLLEEDLALLQGRHLDQDYFNKLLTRDPIRELLHWLDQGDAFKESRGENEWKALVDVCKSQFDFHLDNDGILDGARRLANHEGPWQTVWERYCEAPGRYPDIPGRIRKCQEPVFDLLADESMAGGWPQWNDKQEKELRIDLTAVADLPEHEVRSRVQKLETEHGGRRSLIWAELGEAPLACALEHLAVIAAVTHRGLAAGAVNDLTEAYRQDGWRADDGVLKALAAVEKPADLKAVTTVIQSIYLPWIEDSARYLQKQIDGASYPGGTCQSAKLETYQTGDCVLFVDGLRFDTGKRLLASLQSRELEVSEEAFWTALPSVTATGKPAVSPVRDKILGEEGSSDFEPSVEATGKSLQNYHLKKLLAEAGWSILDRNMNGDGEGMAWCEFGDIDHAGHELGYKLARQIDGMIREISDRIEALFSAGWKRVQVVTDHGWLLLPGGLPKIDLPAALADTKWSRCASLKPGAAAEERTFPWYWNPSHSFALADGVSCFRKGLEYTHGGLSLQECLTLQLSVRPRETASHAATVKFTDAVWKGLRCTVAMEGDAAGLSLDVRSQAGNPSSSVVVGAKRLKGNGTASVVVEDEDLEGREAIIVLIDDNGSLVAQTATKIGGDDS